MVSLLLALMPLAVIFLAITVTTLTAAADRPQVRGLATWMLAFDLTVAVEIGNGLVVLRRSARAGGQPLPAAVRRGVRGRTLATCGLLIVVSLGVAARAVLTGPALAGGAVEALFGTVGLLFAVLLLRRSRG
jgi:hypothetical protein